METSLHDVRNKLLDKAILYGILFLLPALASSIIRYINTGWQNIYYYHISIDILLLALAVFKGKIPLKIKAHCYAILFGSLGIAGALTFGLGNAVVYPILAVTVITLILDKKQGIFYSIVIILCLSIIASLFLFNLRTVKFSIAMLNGFPAFWINTIVGGIYVFLIIVNTIGEFNKFFNNTISNLNNKINELSLTKTELIFISEKLMVEKEKAEQSEHQISQISNNFETCIIYQLQISDDNKRKFNYISESITKYCGYNANEVIANSNLVCDRVNPEDAAKLQILENESIKNFSVIKSELRIKKTDETTAWIYNVQQPRKKDGTIIWDGFGVDITDLKKSQRDLELFKKYLDIAPIGAFWINKDGRFVYVNDTVCKSLGYSNEEMLKLSIYDIVVDIGKQEWVENWNKESINIVTEIYNRRKDGSIFPTAINISKFVYDEFEYFTGFSNDITQKKKTEEALIKSENLYRGLFNNMTSGIILFEVLFDENNIPYDVRAIQANPEYEKLTGVNWFNDVGQSIKKGKIKLPDLYLEKYIEVGLTGKAFQYERYNADIDKYLEVRIFSPIKGLIALLLNDISDRRKNEIRIENMIIALEKNNQLLSESEEKFNKAFNNASIPMGISTLNDSKFINVNKELCRLFEWSKEELIGNTAKDLKIWANYELRAPIIAGIINGKPTRNKEIVMMTKTGKELSVLMSFDKIVSNNVEYLLSSVIDITQLKSAEEALKKNEKHLQELLNSVTNFIYSLEIKNGNISSTRVSDGCETITGYSKLEFESNTNHWFDIIYSEDKQLILDHFKSCTQKLVPINIEHRIINKDGKIVWVRNTPVFKIEENSEILRVDGLIADITEKKQLEQQMITSIIETEEKERKKFSQELHDGLGPLLSAAKIYVYNISNRKKGENIDLYLNKLDSIVDESISSIKEISNNISPHVVKNFGLIIALDTFIKKINSTIKIDFIFNCIKDTRFPDVIEITIYRAVTELINNTIKHAKANNVKISLEEELDHLHVNYSDDGFGFNYYETIKANKGIGLLNIQSRINSFGGVIQYKSNLNKGIEVYIDIPLINALKAS